MLGKSVPQDIAFTQSLLQNPLSPSWVTAVPVFRRLLLDENTTQAALKGNLVAIFFDALTSSCSEDVVIAAIRTADSLAVNDTLVREMLRVRSFQKLSMLLANCVTEHTLSSFRNLLCEGGWEVRKAMAEGCPTLMDILLDTMSTDNEGSKSVAAAGITLSLSTHFPSSAATVAKAKEVIFNDVLHDSYRFESLDCLMETAVMVEQRPVLMSLGFKELIQPFVDNLDCEENFLASLIQALLSASDTSDVTSTGTVPTSPSVIRRIMKVDVRECACMCVCLYVRVCVCVCVCVCVSHLFSLRSSHSFLSLSSCRRWTSLYPQGSHATGPPTATQRPSASS
jgi:hypothetical protein